MTVKCGHTMCHDQACVDCYPVWGGESAFDLQVAGNHYKTLGVQPLELVLRNRGYEAFSGACYTKIVKYMDRKKDDEVEQLEKAAHVLAMWIEQAKKKRESK